MIRTFLNIIISACILAAVPTFAQGDPATIDSLKRALSLARTGSDSVSIMSNLYDVLPPDEGNGVGFEIIEIADRVGQPTEAMDLIRNIADYNQQNEAVLETLYDRTLKFRDSEDRKNTLTFIQILQNIRRARYSDREERNAMLKEFLEKLTINPPANNYEHLWILHGICMALSQEPGGELLENYLDSLTMLANRLPPTAYSIRNAIGLHSAMAYHLDNPTKALEKDRAMLNYLATIEKYFHEKGRKFRSYIPAYYTVYTRLMSNFKVLDVDTLEEYYAKIMEFVNEDPSVRERYEALPAADIYLALGKKDYATALPLLEKYYKLPRNSVSRREFLGYLFKAAKEVGGPEIQRKAATEYAELLEDELKDMGKGFTRDLQMALAVYDMRKELDREEIKRKSTESSMQHTLIILSVIALVILIALLVSITMLYRRNKRLVDYLAKSNETLKKESEKLRKSKADLIKARNTAQKANNLKSDFIKNMSYEVKIPLQAINEYSHLIADCVAETGQTHLADFASLMELNADLLTTIVEDVLRLSEIDSQSIPINPQVVNLKLLLQGTVDSVKRRVQPDVEMILENHPERVDMFADPVRLQQILNCVLTNATKFTYEGTITVDYRLTDDNKKVEISVTDTGIGINPENKDRIFERFVKLDRESQGAGIGLTIARQLARLMGGDVKLDTTYTSGSRFVITLPKK